MSTQTFKSKKWILLAVLFLLCCRTVAADHADQSLRFNADGKFKIVQLTDIHWKNTVTAQQKCLRLIEGVLDRERPDLVVITGDVVTSKPMSEGWAKIIAPLAKRRLPWAAVLGNHDDEYDMNRQEIIAMLAEMPGSLVQAGPQDIGGYGNYVLDIKHSSGSKNAAILYFLDSNGYVQLRENAKRSYDWIKPAQINWFAQIHEQRKQANAGNPLPALMFFHIPLPEYKRIWNDAEIKCIGSKKESVCCAKINSGMFAAIWKAKDVMGVFVGHDHSNDYAGCLYGVCLAYGRVTGFDCYCDLPSRGARVIELIEGSREFNSWIRTADDEVVQKFNYPSSFDK